MVLQDGSVLDLLRKAVKEPFGMELVARAEEMNFQGMWKSGSWRGRILTVFLVVLLSSIVV